MKKNTEFWIFSVVINSICWWGWKQAGLRREHVAVLITIPVITSERYLWWHCMSLGWFQENFSRESFFQSGLSKIVKTFFSSFPKVSLKEIISKCSWNAQQSLSSLNLLQPLLCLIKSKWKLCWRMVIITIQFPHLCYNWFAEIQYRPPYLLKPKAKRLSLQLSTKKKRAVARNSPKNPPNKGEAQNKVLRRFAHTLPRTSVHTASRVGLTELGQAIVKKQCLQTHV